MIRTLRNRRGIGTIPTAVLILAFAIVISAFLYIAYVQIQTTVIRNAMNKALSNLAITISDDTYTALRESNFEAYLKKLTSHSSYSEYLEATYRADVLRYVPLATERYAIDDIRLEFDTSGKKLIYICTCDVCFFIRLFGREQTATVQSVQVSGSHTAKYGR